MPPTKDALQEAAIANAFDATIVDGADKIKAINILRRNFDTDATIGNIGLDSLTTKDFESPETLHSKLKTMLKNPLNLNEMFEVSKAYRNNKN